MPPISALLPFHCIPEFHRLVSHLGRSSSINAATQHFSSVWFQCVLIDAAREVVNMRNLGSESQHMELANEDGNDELNVALGRHDVKHLAFQLYSLDCVKLIYMLRPNDVCLLTVYWKYDCSSCRCFHTITVLSIRGLAYCSPQKSHGSQSLSTFSYEYHKLFLSFMYIGVSCVQDSWTLMIRHLLLLMIHSSRKKKKKITFLLFSSNVQTFFIHFCLPSSGHLCTFFFTFLQVFSKC